MELRRRGARTEMAAETEMLTAAESRPQHIPPGLAARRKALAAAAAELAEHPELAAAYEQHNGVNYLAPNDLAVKQTALTRIALVGSCFLESLQLHKVSGDSCAVDMYTANNVATLNDWPESKDGKSPYDLQIVQLGLRFIMPNGLLYHLPYDEPERYEAALNRVKKQLVFQLERRMVWNQKHGLLTFVVNFLMPQRNPMGALFPRYDIRNPEYFIERINEHLERTVATYRNAYVLDLDRIAASLGRRYCQDDMGAPISHNALIGLRPPVTERLEPIAAMVAHYDVRWPREFGECVWREINALYRTIRQVDSVKLVVIDLDDTLWTGVIGEMADPDATIVDAWQHGFIEALMYLKKRGVLLGILSKNEESRIREIWPKLFRENLLLDDFAVVKINWKPKLENMREVLAGVNLLPRNVIFIDDNPAERDAMKQAFPDMRILGRHPYYIRHTLLWAPETQVPALTAESARRTEMIQAQLEREEDRKNYSAEDFLAAAAPSVNLAVISGQAHARFARVSELVGKTNQFNTTGRRWAPNEWDAFFNAGGRVIAFEVNDSYTAYGLVGAVLVANDVIEQWVMSCRVLGYHIEQAVMSRVVGFLRAGGARAVRGKLVETDVNFPCRDLFSKCGFRKGDGAEWVLGPKASVAVPAHVTIDEV
jgi:FkbH-like protein